MNTTSNILDQAWYERLTAISKSQAEVFSLLEPASKQEASLRRQFETSGRQSNPDLTARHLDPTSLTKTRQLWQVLADDISRHESNPTVSAAYLARIAESIAQCDLLLASAAGNMPAFDHHNQLIYSRPDHEVFAAACGWLRQRATTAKGGGLDQLAADVLEAIPDLNGNPSELFPSDELFQRIKALHLAPGGYLEQLFGNSLDTTDFVTSDIGDPICRQAINHLGANFELQDSANGLWAILASRRAVVRPRKYHLNRKAFMAIVGHEVGSHLAEFVHGSRQPLRLLHSGLDRYETGNEGRAWIREQIVYDSPAEYAALPSTSLDLSAPFTVGPSFEYRIALHVAISLSLGYGGHRYSFSDVYGVLVKLYRLWHQVRRPDADDQLAHNAAWHLAVRVCKGTDGQGSAYRKDIVYLEGNIRCWQVAGHHPELIMQGDLGKFDIANPEHINILQSLKILPVFSAGRTQ